MHLGIGAFHRAHQADFTEDAVAATGEDWGICGVTQRSESVVHQLVPQDGLYTVATRDGHHEALRVLGVVREVKWALGDLQAVLDRMAAPSTTVITVTVTEKGYRHDPATRRFRPHDPEVAADLQGRGPSTVIGQLVEALARRFRDSGAPLTILCCDNLPANGHLLSELVREFAARRYGGDRLPAWVEENVRFPCTVVDRIVPATTAEDRTGISARLGVRDEGAVVTEPFRQWVIENDFRAARPRWELAGAMLTVDVRPYEQIKLRMLNGGHSTIAYLGALAGYEFVADAVGGPLLAVVRGLMSGEVAPTLEVPEGFDLAAYQEDLLRRFANRALRHRTLQIAMDGSQKLPQRLLATVLDRRSAGAEATLATLGVAGWMRFVSARRSDAGRRLVIDDPLADAIAEHLAHHQDPAHVVDALLSMQEVFSEELATDRVFRDTLVEQLEMLARDGAERTARQVAAEA